MPELSVVEALRAFHARYAGASDRVFGRGDIGDGRNSYAWLADEVPASARRVLDLACGDGPALQAVLRRLPEVEGIGLDMSPEELAEARRRLGPDVRLDEGLAQALPYPDGSFDAVVSHMALMLMDDVDTVFAEVARVLRDDGVLAFVVGDRRDPGPVPKRFYAALTARIRAAEVAIAYPRRDWDLETVRASLPGFAVRDEPLDLRMEVPRDALWPFLQVINYNTGLLPEAHQEALATEVAALADELALGVEIPWTFPFRGFVARRSGRGPGDA